jgi:hypothetical protein
MTNVKAIFTYACAKFHDLIPLLGLFQIHTSVTDTLDDLFRFRLALFGIGRHIRPRGIYLQQL